MPLGEKRTGKATKTERTGRHGMKIDGLDYPVTPHSSKRVEKGSIGPRLTQMPSYSENPFDLNPTLKGFKQAEPFRSAGRFPANTPRLFKNVMEAGARDSQDGPFKETAAKKYGPASVRTSRG